MNELKSHIFVKHPDRKKATCWSCDSKKEEHQYTVFQAMIEFPAPNKTRKKGNARSARTKGPGMRAVR
jgi:hypothetical protein